MCRKDPSGTGFIYQKVDDNINKYAKHPVVVTAVTESSLLDSIASICWEHGSFDTHLRHTSSRTSSKIISTPLQVSWAI